MSAPDELMEQAQRYRAEHHHLTETVERVRRYLEVAVADTDPGRREMAAELIAIVGVPQ